MIAAGKQQTAGSEVEEKEAVTHPVSSLLLAYTRSASKYAQQEAQTHQDTDRHVDARASVVSPCPYGRAGFRRGTALAGRRGRR